MKNPAPAYFVGDIHGRCDLLVGMLEFIETHASARGITPTVNFLGDITDRGPHSMQAMDLVFETLHKWDNSRLHMGNHDEWFLEALLKGDDAPYIESWLVNGGINTILSYERGYTNDILDVIRKEFPHHVEMLQAAIPYRETGKFISVHAGVQPGISLSEQTNRSLRWIRDPFLDYVDNRMRPVIHGHTILNDLPVVTENRISIDTGAFHSGRLTCLFLDHDAKEISFHQSTKNMVTEVNPIIEDRGQGSIYDRLPELFNLESEFV